jgi:GntR family transcriptional repressor for pyruvate dehydrogenase complex
MSVPVIGRSPIGHVVRAPKTAEIIATAIRQQIVSRDLKEGDTLPPEVGLMGEFGVSRPTLREAYRILETESLIHIRRGSRGGAQVTAPKIEVAARYVGLLLQMSDTTIGEVYEARAILEPAAARLLATRRKVRDLDDLDECIATVDKHITRAATEWPKSMNGWPELSWQFHELLVVRAGNRAMEVQWGVLRDVIETHMASVVSRNWNRPEVIESFRRSVKSYSKLVALLRDKDADGAERHWRTHMEVTGKMLLGNSRAKERVDVFN